MTDRIEVLTHSSIRITSSVGIIYIDPYQVGREYHDADYIFITHDHYDHYSPDDLKKVIGENTVIIVPKKMEQAVLTDGFQKVVSVSTGKKMRVEKLEFETIPAYNLIKPFHPKSSGWCGYTLLIEGKRIYIAGDTDATKEAKAVQCDIALVPIGGTFTMDAKNAAELINTICPETAIPTHYGSVVGRKTDADVFEKYINPSIKVEKKIKF